MFQGTLWCIASSESSDATPLSQDSEWGRNRKPIAQGNEAKKRRGVGKRWDFSKIAMAKKAVSEISFNTGSASMTWVASLCLHCKSLLGVADSPFWASFFQNTFSRYF